MIKNFINSISIINFIKIVFVFTIFVSGVGEVSAFLNPATRDKPSTGNEDTACKDKPLHGQCNFTFVGINQTGECIPTKNGSNLYCENTGDAVIRQNDECTLTASALTYYEGRPCRAKVSPSDPNPIPIRGVCVPNGGTNYVCELPSLNYCSELNCPSKNPSKPYCIKKSPAVYECSDVSPCGVCGAGEKCQVNGTEKKCVPQSDYKCSTDCTTTPNTPNCVKTSESPEKWECKASAEPPTPPGYTDDPNTPPSTDPNSPTPTIEYVEFKNPIRFNNLIELLAGITNALLTLLGVIAVLVVMASGLKYMTSSNPGEVSQAVGGIRNAIIGIVVIMGAYLIINYVISALL